MRNTTHINRANRLVVKFRESIRPVSLDDRTCLARFVAERMYGETKVPPGVPYANDVEKLDWVMDQHNDWFMQIESDGAGFTVWHRAPQERHIMILGGLEYAMTRMTLALLPSQLTGGVRPPVFVMEDPNFLGLPTEEGARRCAAHEGERKLDVPLRPCYVHGNLERRVGYDCARFARGHIRDVEEQDALLIDANGVEHKCMILAITLPHATKPTRAAFIIDPEEKAQVREYLTAKVADTTSDYPRPML